MSLYGEVELRNRLFQEGHARDVQKIQELSRICCEQSGRARRARIDELSGHQEESCDCKAIDDSDSGLTEQSKFSVRRQRFFTIRIGKQLWSGPRSRSDFYYSTLQRFDSELPRDTPNGTTDHLLKKDCPLQSSTIPKFGILLSVIET